ncbi:hypothetical protein [Plasmodium yoelii yoelii]|uniref:Uncharacterized protein n=1 Tax=Plasmodium yoelii yoelii TaxID=73239 RepID=Q7RJQ2_PLAYO|nr:hypothetical protein [Plasmodium yoelii yoelii]
MLSLFYAAPASVLSASSFEKANAAFLEFPANKMKQNETK